jgi:hypothetical protein
VCVLILRIWWKHWPHKTVNWGQCWSRPQRSSLHHRPSWRMESSHLTLGTILWVSLSVMYSSWYKRLEYIELKPLFVCTKQYRCMMLYYCVNNTILLFSGSVSTRNNQTTRERKNSALWKSERAKSFIWQSGYKNSRFKWRTHQDK